MRILITGANGQLGQTLIRLLSDMTCALGDVPSEYENAQIIASDVDTLDISDMQQVAAFLDWGRYAAKWSCDDEGDDDDFGIFDDDSYDDDPLREPPNLIINCAAMTNVDGCETDAITAMKVNAMGAANLAAAAHKCGAKLIHVSTDYVFAGNGTQPYCEWDATAPNTVYGKSKLLGEQMALQQCRKTFVVRTSWLYGLIGKNFVKTMRMLGQTKEQISVVCDQRGNPTNALDLAYHLLLLALTEDYGVYHCTGTGECSWYDFACEIMRLSGLSCRVNPCTTAEYPSKTPRPAYSALRNLHLECTVGDCMRPWQEALAEYIAQLDAQN